VEEKDSEGGSYFTAAAVSPRSTLWQKLPWSSHLGRSCGEKLVKSWDSS